MQQEFYDKIRSEFLALGKGGRYTEAQKERAFELIKDKGIRSAARILGVPRRTLQRWCRQHGVYVRRCPSWVYEWAERRRKRREFWQRRGYC
jgi:transposase-like protein